MTTIIPHSVKPIRTFVKICVNFRQYGRKYGYEVWTLPSPPQSLISRLTMRLTHQAL